MATKHYATRGRRAPPIDPYFWSILNESERPPPDDDDEYGRDFRIFTTSLAKLDALWKEHGAVITREWATGERHGLRPNFWWRNDAPRLAPEKIARFEWGEYEPCIADFLIEPRLLISGSGRPGWRFQCQTHKGVPVTWEGDPNDPPVFETEHAYLKRHGLLFPGERAAKIEPATEVEFIAPSRPRAW